MTPEELLRGLERAREDKKEFVLFLDNNGYYHKNEVANLNPKKSKINESVISFEVETGQQYYNMNLIEEVYVANKMI
ncbi:MAG: hypothetical protein KAQ87_04145 [Candidatus Pacebacteria bacterium]|nr:hypothetical protein [Candidatus Paceibacterota bacterium]